MKNSNFLRQNVTPTRPNKSTFIMCLLTLSVLLGLSMLSACSQDLFQKEIPIEKEFSIPGSFSGISNPLAPEDVLPTDFSSLLNDALQQSFKTEGLNLKAITSFKLTSMRIEVTNAEENNKQVRDLSFIKNMTFLIGAKKVEAQIIANSSDGAFAEKITSYDFVIPEVELAELAKNNEELLFSTKVELGDRPNFKTDLKLKAVFLVKADPLKAL